MLLLSEEAEECRTKPLTCNNQIGTEGTHYLPRPQFFMSAKAAAVLKGS